MNGTHNDEARGMSLACRGLNYTYPGSDNRVIENLSFSMEGPGFHAVFGPSGVGKTSFARLLASHRSKPDLPVESRGIDTILYSYNLERLPGWAPVGSHLDRVCPAGREALKQELVGIFRLEPLLDSRFSQLSMGQQNRMNLIRYLVQDFDLLILDECLANVDEALRETILLAVKALFRDRMFLYISHNLSEVVRFCDRILVLGEPSRNKGSRMVQGLDLETGDVPSKQGLDRAMLEVMNAV